MINFVGKDFKDIKIGSKQVVKVMQGIDVVWEKKSGTLVYSDTGRSSYDISVNGWSKVNPNKNYRFVTSKPDNEYSIVVSGSYNTVKNNSIFRITKNCDIKIKNTDYNYYDIKIYEVDEKATIVI
ncbi:hypothetical protein B9N49_00665 [Finegoldia magna]|uniref:Uncharacterized protein n=1 Tax=Finegoldia magna TaxID=1260 RepID=A0A233V9V9_FINMA|nr:hypothetical protein [Finegoldia magna]OXZ29167.1 hypothetical protein B9N49_00665 [Finegoldia magna]